MPDDGLSKVKRAELIGHVAELDQLIEEQTTHLALVAEMGLFLPIIEVRLQRLKESRRLYLSALKHLLGEDVATTSQATRVDERGR